ncbi:MAG: phage integrase SAM-like domain-containing protein, partial [Bacteroidales bacterium]
MITFILTHKQRERSTIAILVSFKGKKYRRLIKESILTALWLPKKKRAKVVSGDASALMVNAMIDKWEMAAMQAVTHFKQFVYPPSADEFFAMILDKVYLESKQEEASGPICFVEYTEKFIDRYKGAKSESCIKKYNTALNKLKEFEKDREVRLMFEDMNIEFYNDFKQWFFDQRFSTNYFGNMIKVVKQVYREARVVDKVHAGDDIEHRDFVGTRVDTESIYLSELELSRIVDLDLSIDSLEINYPSMDQEQLRKKSESYKRVRERFLIGAYTGLRVSDFCRLSDINFDKEFIRIRAQKT